MKSRVLVSILASVVAVASLSNCGGSPKQQASASTAAPATSPKQQASASTAAPATDAVPIPVDLQDNVALAAELGRAIYTLDKVSAIATDALFATGVNVEAEGLAGYVPLREATDDGKPLPSFLVTFFTRDDPPRNAYQVRVAPNVKPTVEAFKPAKPTNPAFVALARARQTAIRAVPTPTQSLNPVIFPAGAIGEDGILVYLIAATNKHNVAVFGKHFRAVLSSDGTELLSLTPLSKSELEIPFRAGDDSAALVVTHIVTDFPIETHVFTSLLLGMPVFVGTRRGLWRIEGDTVAFLGDKAPTESQ